MKVIHCHHSFNPISGEMKRIINIDRDVVGFLSNSIIEVEFYSIRYYSYVTKQGQFKLSDKVIRKHYVPNIPRLGLINSIYCSIVILFLLFKYKPSFYIEEWSLPWEIALIKRLFKTCRIGLDIHGAAPEEYYYLNHKVSKPLLRQERSSILAADFIICQSDEMKRYLDHKYQVKERIVVYRCGVDTGLFKIDSNARLRVRDSLGISEDEILFVYSGGMHGWQKIHESVQYYVKYHSLNDHSRLLILTKEDSVCRSILLEVGGEQLLNSTLIFSLSYDEVPLYLNAADVAFLLRDDVIMNAVASPTKLAEYLACGLPILSKSVALKWISQDGQKYIFDIETIEMNHLSEMIRSLSKQEISDYASRVLSLNIDRKTVHSFLMSFL